MRTCITAIFAQLLLASASFAVTWDVVNLSVVVRQGSGGNVETTVLSSRSYLNFVADSTSTPKSDLFVGFREDTGVIAVVKRSDETVLYNIVSGLGAGGTAANGTNTKGFISVAAVISSLNTDFSGFTYDSFKRTSDGSIKKLKRQFVGGTGNQTIIGTARTTGKKIEL
ncbi:MAG: hypothetical protein ABI680_02710 [Chthoniobacteraceae bacterium]